jgi:hypothetical protein
MPADAGAPVPDRRRGEGPDTVIDGQINITVDVVAPRTPEGLSLVLKPSHGSRLYRIVPVRDPDQPRFWCLIVLRCSRAGAVEEQEDPWMIANGLTRDLLPKVLAEIQADVMAWLEAESRRALREWIHQVLPDPLDVIRATNETRRRGGGDAEWEPGGSYFPGLARELSPERS